MSLYYCQAHQCVHDDELNGPNCIALDPSGMPPGYVGVSVPVHPQDRLIREKNDELTALRARVKRAPSKSTESHK